MGYADPYVIDTVHASAIPRTIAGHNKKVDFTKSGSEIYPEVVTQRSGVIIDPSSEYNLTTNESTAKVHQRP